MVNIIKRLIVEADVSIHRISAKMMAVLRSQLETTVEKRVARDAWLMHRVRSIKMKLDHDAFWPDRLFILPGGDVLWIEFKAPGGVLSPGQDGRINWLASVGHDVEVHDTYDGAMSAIKARLKICL